MTAFQWLLSSLTNKIDLEQPLCFYFSLFGNPMLLNKQVLVFRCFNTRPDLSPERAIIANYETVPCFCLLQSKDIGVQMHEELVKVTNELYTVSKRIILALLCLCLYLPVSSPFPLLLAACSSSILTSSLSYTKQTVKAGSRTLHPADMPYQQQTPHQQVVSFHSWGCKRRTFASFLQLWISPLVWRGERSCLWLSFKQTQQICAAEVHRACSRHVHTLPFLSHVRCHRLVTGLQLIIYW